MTDKHELFFRLDGEMIPFTEGDTLITAASRAGTYIPHLCHHDGLSPHGSCRLCIVKVNGKISASCTTLAQPDLEVINSDSELHQFRKQLLQMLFVEGNHFCPGCEVSGQCQLQALAYDHGMLETRYDHFYPVRTLDCSHPDVLLDRDRCINCALCVRASRELDDKDNFSLGGRGQHTRLQANSESGQLKDTRVSSQDMSQQVCPVGALLPKTGHYKHIAGERVYDQQAIHTVGNVRPDMGDSNQ